MDFLRLGSAVLRSALSAGGKRRTGALRVLGGSGSLLRSPAALQLATGIAFGLFEHYGRKRAAGAAPPPVSDGVRTLPENAGADSLASARVPPPLPPRARGSVPPPLPAAKAPSALDERGWRALRVALAAARADGELSGAERSALLAEARAAGAESALEHELARTPAPAELGGAHVPLDDRRALYALAFAVLRADEELNARERAWLASFARSLELADEACSALEREVAARIERAARAHEPAPEEETR